MTSLQWVGLIGFVGVLAIAIKNISLSGLSKDRHQQHLVFGSAATLFTLWMLRVGIYDDLYVHVMGLSALTLMLGFRYAIITGALALLGATAAGYSSWQSFGIQGLLGIVLPIGLTYLIFMLAFHRISRHLFVYIFICAFFPGALTAAVKTFALGGYFYLDGIYQWDIIVDNYLLLIPLLVFPEAFFNGLAITMLVIYQPSWVYTFHDKFYLDK
ncbi:hypothetical protein GTH32_02060 [Alteromonas sp. 345S023]|uniref:Energy-coupling factor ABC transporter permease n=1 Tax=Alteromonas profundi TaxID=2696062 RepID=A0A7X5LJR4_9ALTE|nr:energy-coupling factor ABC transporter permease [Alteromonas profundi]NDV89980.1 hypothetical protein [Alteromonas profundi]